MSEKTPVGLVVVTADRHPAGRTRLHLVNALDFILGRRGIKWMALRGVEREPEFDAATWACKEGVPFMVIPQNWRDGPSASARQVKQVEVMVQRGPNASMVWLDPDRITLPEDAMLLDALAGLGITHWYPPESIWGQAWAATSAPVERVVQEAWD
ncbi:hypothetical protein [Planktothrix phage Pra-JY27]|nr:hypothetical protein [Planktothrix phage Pag-Yong1]WEV89238.1 hypothetical protein [Synechococcus phage MinM2]